MERVCLIVVVVVVVAAREASLTPIPYRATCLSQVNNEPSFAWADGTRWYVIRVEDVRRRC